MTSYGNFIQVFPSRCLEVLIKTESSKSFKEREVTIAIAIASSALIIPFERLKSPKEGDPEHIANDRERDYVIKLEKKLKDPLKSWIKGDSWEISNNVKGSLIRYEKESEYWISKQEFKKVGESQQTGTILSIIRNSLAHGNIVVFPSDPNSQIKNLFFLSRNYDFKLKKPLDEYTVLQSTPEDFVGLIKEWISYVKIIHVPETVVQLSDYSLLYPGLNPA